MSGGAETSEAQEACGASHSETNRIVCDNAGFNDSRPIELPGPRKTNGRTGTADIQDPRAVFCLWRDGAHMHVLPEVGQWCFSGLKTVGDVPNKVHLVW